MILSTIEDRILKLREELELSQEEFGEKIGVTKSTISLIERKLRNPSERVIRDICREFNVNEEWLRAGEGEVHVALTKKQVITDFMGDLIVGEEDSFKHRLIEALAKLNPEDWEVLERLAESIIKKS